MRRANLAILLIVPAALLVTEPGTAQDAKHLSHDGGSGSGAHSSYAGGQHRPIKALSDQQIGDLKAGRGMGLALAAELNGYPGPTHVLELADSLQLSNEQKARTKTLVDAMKAETIPIGTTLILEEMALDRLFADRIVTVESLEAASLRLSSTQSKLRSAHLRYHLSMKDLLSSTQIDRYIELRGYPAGGHRKHGAP